MFHFNHLAHDQEYFNPRPPWGGRHANYAAFLDELDISIHALRGEGDSNLTPSMPGSFISIHALRGEGDKYKIYDRYSYRKFQSTPSVGRATNSLALAVLLPIFQSTPSVGRATAKIYKYTILRLYIVYIKLYIFATAVLFT